MIAWFGRHWRTPETAEQWFATRERRRGDPQLERDFESWLASHPDNARRYALCELAWQLAGPATQRWQSLAAETPRPEGQPVRRRFVVGALIAAGVAGVAAFLIPERESAQAPQRFATRAGEQRMIVLQDGSQVTLNTRTQLSVSITQNARFVTLDSGEAFFEVRHDERRPFRIAADLADITVLGTRFAVHRRRASLEVSTVTGLVRVSAPALPKGAGEVLVHAGERATVDTKHDRVVIGTADLKHIENWREQRLEFDAVRLEDLLEEFNRYTEIPIVAASTEIAGMRVSAVLSVGDVAALSRTLDSAYGLTLVERGQAHFVVKASNTDFSRPARGRN